MPAISKDKAIVLATLPAVIFLFVMLHLRTTSPHRLQAASGGGLPGRCSRMNWDMCGARQDLVRWGERSGNLSLQAVII